MFRPFLLVLSMRLLIHWPHPHIKFFAFLPPFTSSVSHRTWSKAIAMPSIRCPPHRNRSPYAHQRRKEAPAKRRRAAQNAIANDRLRHRTKSTVSAAMTISSKSAHLVAMYMFVCLSHVYVCVCVFVCAESYNWRYRTHPSIRTDVNVWIHLIRSFFLF